LSVSEGVLDGVGVGNQGGRNSSLASGAADCLADEKSPAAAEVLQNDDVVG
jgi:hypothetical protein